LVARARRRPQFGRAVGGRLGHRRAQLRRHLAVCPFVCSLWKRWIGAYCELCVLGSKKTLCKNTLPSTTHTTTTHAQSHAPDGRRRVRHEERRPFRVVPDVLDGVKVLFWICLGVLVWICLVGRAVERGVERMSRGACAARPTPLLSTNTLTNPPPPPPPRDSHTCVTKSSSMISFELTPAISPLKSDTDSRRPLRMAFSHLVVDEGEG
jgi:hypothetical protein